MLKKIFMPLFLVLIIISCTSKQNNTKIINEDIPKFTIDELYKNAANFVGKEVIVSGIVDHICKHGGKRLLLVSDNNDLHIDTDERFDENLIGKEIEVKGIIKEFRVDEAYLLKMEENNIQKHKTGETDDNFYERKKKQIEKYRSEMKEKGVDHLSFYSLDYISHTIKK